MDDAGSASSPPVELWRLNLPGQAVVQCVLFEQAGVWGVALKVNSQTEDVAECTTRDEAVRLRAVGTQRLTYVGQGLVCSRVSQHLRSALSDGPEAEVLRTAMPLEVSWVAGAWLDHQRLELENDLIAAHVLTTHEVPPAQFLG